MRDAAEVCRLYGQPGADGNVGRGEFGGRAWLRVVFSEEEQQRWQ